jgi:hypothetical protein
MIPTMHLTKHVNHLNHLNHLNQGIQPSQPSQPSQTISTKYTTHLRPEQRLNSRDGGIPVVVG